MPLVRKPMRYAHPEGHTDVCYFMGEKGGLVTCGTDGDVRTWIDLMDDDPSASCISEQAIAVVSKKEKLFVGNDNNTVQILSHPDLEKAGILARFSAAVSTLSTTKDSDLIASGACDMRIQVINISTSDSFELNGHEAPILGLSLDPKEEFLASSSGDGTIRIWSIKDKKSVHTWNNVVPKCNGFFTAKVYATPSFQSKNGEYLAYPQGKEIIVVERSSWKETFRLRSTDIKNELSICKFSECGTLLAASSTYGEIVVWNVDSKEVVGYVEHQQNAKITSLVWNPHKSDEIAFCDALGQLGCIEVNISKSFDDLKAESITDGNIADDDFMFNDNDDEDDNVISLSKIKASVIDEDQKSVSSVVTEKIEEKRTLPEINLQEPFQPGSSPVHLLSRYMMWNDVGIVMCFKSEDDEDSNIEVNFHDVTVHHSMHINNYLRHTMAALSNEALALAAPAYDGSPSKIVVVALQGWGSGNKEWSMDLPDGEEALAIAAGNNFVAVATSARTLRIFMPGGSQREVLALPGSIVAMNGYGNNLAVAYHSSIGAFGDQILSLLWVRICGPNLKSHTLPVPLSPASNLMWLGFSDLGSPVVMDAEGIINIYDKKAFLWRVASNTNRQNKGKFDSYFIIGISESERSARCILCKGSHYPPTTPRPIVTEIPLIIPLCDPESEKSEKEAKVWQLGSNPVDEREAVLALVANACRNNVQFRAVELCQQIASQKVIELAIKYAGRLNKIALANKLESIADTKEPDEIIREVGTQEDIFNDRIETPDEDELLVTPSVKTPDVEIKPLTPSQTFSRRNNPFKKKGNTPISKGLMGLDKLPEKPKPVSTAPISAPKSKKPKEPPTHSFVNWLTKNKKKVEEEYADLEPNQRMKIAYSRFEEETKSRTNTNEVSDDETSKKRKLSPVDLVQEAMGTLGPWHIVIAVAVSLVKFPVAWHQLSIVFLAPDVDFTCASPKPFNSSMALDKHCSVNVGNDTVEKCTKFHYDRSIFRETIITEWDLVCDRKYLADLVQSLTMFGILVGNMIFGIMSDRIGRKIPLMIAIFIQSVTGFVTAYSPWYEFFLVFKFISAVATGGTMLISFVLLMEIVGPKWRSTLSVLFHLPFLLGFLMNPLIAYLTRTWTGFQMAVSIPPIFLLSYYWIVPESPRWLLAVGRTSEAEAILTKAAEKNRIPLSKVTAVIEAHNVQAKAQKKQEVKYNITHLFRTPNLRIKTLCICVNWFVCGLCFFGLVQFMGKLAGNIFVNTALSAAVELPGTIIVLYLISRVSRLRILIGGSAVSGVMLLLLIFFENPTIRVTLATIGIGGMSLSFPTVYLYSSEVFPTVVRNVGIGAGSTCARIGSMIAPFVVRMGGTWPWLPPLLFGSGLLFGVALCFFLPETMNCELPETIEDGENFGKKRPRENTV
ncbi:WD repeat and HMG-box DNA-binding protein 1 [Nasonia vitripennis]|uniref:Major facilitator superfamily (MFS) profile domain-containing protein n=1 Tax=Nasonia vitripennis TaxID=7425 RepID=A0A7M7LVE2_NASVI|nr:WD repeat and HMG-box DNA-binding protein 1 [Nasonia vitripennis]